MFRKKYKRSWLIISIVVLPVSYWMAGKTLMRADTEVLNFTVQKMEGLKQYETLYPVYMEAVTQSPIDKQKVQQIRERIRNISDEYNLILDPQPMSYYLADLLYNKLPWVWDLVEYRQDPKVRMAEALNHTSSVFARHNASAELQESLAKVQQGLRNNISAKAAAADIIHLSDVSLHELRNILQARYKVAQDQRKIGWGILFLFYVLSVVLIRAAIKNYVYKSEVQAAIKRQHLIKQLAEKNKELESFAYVTAHDLKEPIRTIRSFTQLLQHGGGTAEETEERLAILEQTSARAERLLNDWMSYTQLSKGVLEYEPCKVTDELNRVLQDLAGTLAGIDYELHQAPLASIHLLTVPSLFRRIWLNLIDNAIKYRQPQQRLIMKLSAERQEKGWVFSLQDNGMGMEKKFFAKAFEPFTRFHHAPIDGSGIGLASCKKMIGLLHGRIWFEPIIGHGVKVCFFLPDQSDIEHSRVA